MNSIETQTLEQLEMLGTANVGFRQKVVETLKLDPCLSALCSPLSALRSPCFL